MKDINELLNHHAKQQNRDAADNIGEYLNLELVESKPEIGEYTMHCHTTKWMCNINGTIHGGMSSTMVDQAMGYAAYTALPGEGIISTVEMNLSYHRPLLPDEDVVIVAKLRSAGKRLFHTAAEVYRAAAPDKLCLSATAVYFFKSKDEMR